jgi:NAD(P)-dependent dehydrogenase (short-subunit alcohol dehydrogenase family)
MYQHFFPTPNINPDGKYVLISGCDTGFGNGLAIELDKQGFNVLAGVYNLDNKDSLTKILSSRATVFQLDVTRQEDIDVAYEMIRTKTQVLHALVNNAGIGSGGLIDWISLELMRKMMDVNFFGHVAMTKKFLPILITKRDSRVVNVCSVADCLRREMAVWNLRVSIIEPGFMRTAIVEGHDKSLRNLWNGLADEVKDRWGEDLLNKLIQDIRNDPFIKRAEDPVKVVQAVKHAVMNTVPRIRYRPGWQSSYIMFPMSRGPAWLTDFLMTRKSLTGVPPAGVSKQRNE